MKSRRWTRRLAVAGPGALLAALAVAGLSAPGLPLVPPPHAAPVGLTFPKIYPAQRARAGVRPPARSDPGAGLWLVAVFGAVGLVGAAGGHFLGWPGLRRRARPYAQ